MEPEHHLELLGGRHQRQQGRELRRGWGRGRRRSVARRKAACSPPATCASGSWWPAAAFRHRRCTKQEGRRPGSIRDSPRTRFSDRFGRWKAENANRREDGRRWLATPSGRGNFNPRPQGPWPAVRGGLELTAPGRALSLRFPAARRATIGEDGRRWRQRRRRRQRRGRRRNESRGERRAIFGFPVGSEAKCVAGMGTRLEADFQT